MEEQAICRICGVAELRTIPAFEKLLRVTSDSRIWKNGGKIAQCQCCGLIQKVYDTALQNDIEQVYSGYQLYFQGCGEEQKIFIQGNGRPRSAILVDHFLEALTSDFLSETPVKWLDLGCGRGHLLKAVASERPHWQFYGADISEKSRETIESIKGVEAYFAKSIEEIDETFDVLSMSHVLEHIPEPLAFLRAIHSHLSEKGFLLIGVPNWLHNPFDLLVTDHCLHFSSAQLVRLLQAAGFEVLSSSDEIIPKELVVIARPCRSSQREPSNGFNDMESDWVSLLHSIDWLSAMVAWANMEAQPSVGLFGTALAATWLDASCQSRFGFFVEEDPDRTGCTYLGRPVVTPTQLSSDAKVLVPLPTEVATDVCRRLNSANVVRFLSM